MTIVIVDDSVTNLIVLKSLSASASGMTAIGFSDPTEAATYLEANPVELVVLDYSMPGMNGIQLTSRIRNMPHHYSTPIVMVTHASDHETRFCALQVGATAFLNKPVNAGEFKDVVTRLIKSGPDNKGSVLRQGAIHSH